MMDGGFPPMPDRRRVLGDAILALLILGTTILLFLAMGVLIAFLAGPVDAQDPGEYYHGLSRADGMNCCGGQDCRALAPGEFREGQNGYEVLYKGKWLLVEPIAILPDVPSWDGRNHACIGDYSESGGGVSVRCLILDIRS